MSRKDSDGVEETSVLAGSVFDKYGAQNPLIK